MQERILVPLDGSRTAEAILPHVTTLARASASSVQLLHVANPLLANASLLRTTGRAQEAQALWQYELDHQQQYLAGVRQRLEEAGIQATALVEPGNPAATIVDYACQSPDISMIAMMTHGRTGLGRWMFGSVAQKVLHATPVPLFLLPAEASAQPVDEHPLYRRILVPLDGSAFAEQALGWALAVALHTGATLTLCTVLPEIEDIGLVVGGIVPFWAMAERESEISTLLDYLEQTAHRLASSGVSIQTYAPSGGDVATQILQAAGQEQADCLAMATHGRGGFQRFWLGSVAMRVLHSCTLPICLVRSREERAALAQEQGA